MSALQRPFLLRVESDDDDLAECIARAIEPALAVRGTRAHVVTRRRALKGASIVIAVWDDALRTRWLAPIEVPAEPLAAAEHVTRFLEEWGFMPGARAGGARRASTS